MDKAEPQAFEVKFDGLTLTEDQRKKVNSALQSAALREIARLDLLEKPFKIPRDGLINGIIIQFER